MFKKVLSTVVSLALFIDFSYKQTSAALPPKHPTFLLIDSINSQRQDILRIKERIPEAINIINRYRNEVAGPLDNLRNQVTNAYIFSVNNETMLSPAVTFSDNSNILQLANGFNSFYKEANALVTYVIQLISAIRSFNRYASTSLSQISDIQITQFNNLLDQLPERINDLARIVTQIHNFSAELDQIEIIKPTQYD